MTRTLEVICIIVVSLLDLAWIISEFVALSGVNDSKDAIVFGQTDGSKINGYVYFTSFCFILYCLTRIGAYFYMKDIFETYVGLTLFLAATSAVGCLIYEVPVTVLVYVLSKCRSNYLIRAQIASRVIQIVAVIARIILLSIMNVKALMKQEKEKTIKSILTCLATLLYLGGAAAVLGLSITTLKDHKLINSYDPHTSDVSVMFVPPGVMPSGTVSDFSIGNKLSSRGATTDQFIALTSFDDLITSDTVRTRRVRAGKSQRTIEGHYLKASLDCTIIPFSLRPTSCTTSLQLMLRYDVYASSASPFTGRLYFNCGLLSRGQCHEGCPPAAEGWEVRLINRVRRNTTAGTDDSLISTPWQDVASCGETPVKMDDDMSACRASAFGVSSLLLFSSVTSLWLLSGKRC